MARPGRGYRFPEVLVAAAVVVVVIGLLIPATMKVRCAAARARCTNHLKQLAGATLNYHGARDHFPPGGSAAPCLSAATPAAREAGGWTWAYALLPYLGQDRLYHDPDPAAVTRTPVEVFYCPARRTAGAYADKAKLDYAANAGADPDGRTGVIAPTGVPPLRLSDLRSGTAGLVLFSGKRLNRATLGTSPDDDDAYPTAGWGPDYEVYRTSAEHPAPDADEPGGLAPRTGFGAAHPGVFCVSFADGSVRPLRYTIDPAVWRKVCQRDGPHELPSPNDN
ncbi:MAG TPA: DUF1559 domain-containing protein [Urbifossiella sp.]|nr:DUF1559 domain-containing protein [Urbifossiella sp.]